MRTLNWPHLMVSSGSGYIVSQVDAAYYDVDAYRPIQYADNSVALKAWKGDNNFRRHIKLERLIYVCEVVAEIMQQFTEPIQEDAVVAVQEVMTLKELAERVQECTTFEDLQALGVQNASFGLHDWDIYSTCLIRLDPENGQFFWQVTRHSDEFEDHSFMACRLIDVSAMPMQDMNGAA